MVYLLRPREGYLNSTPPGEVKRCCCRQVLAHAPAVLNMFCFVLFLLLVRIRNSVLNLSSSIANRTLPALNTDMRPCVHPWHAFVATAELQNTAFDVWCLLLGNPPLMFILAAAPLSPTLP
ncbi:unnamed protein product, partial [Ectocarpus sp. 13 AM-2016]